eukprot:Pgem_evm1s11096
MNIECGNLSRSSSRRESNAADFVIGNEEVNLEEILNNVYQKPFEYDSFRKYCENRYSLEGLQFIE